MMNTEVDLTALWRNLPLTLQQTNIEFAKVLLARLRLAPEYTYDDYLRIVRLESWIEALESLL